MWAVSKSTKYKKYKKNNNDCYIVSCLLISKFIWTNKSRFLIVFISKRGLLRTTRFSSLIISSIT
jgi:hypothetical protein